MSGMLKDLYLKNISVTIRTELQYRFGVIVMTLTFVVEPIIYMAVWTTVANQNGGTTGGMTTGMIAAYYIVWTLVRTANIVFTPYGFEWRIRTGHFSVRLLRPAHPIHYDLSWFIGQKVPALLMWFPVAALLVLLFRPTLSPNAVEILVFCAALCGAYLIRSIYLWTLGLAAFWTTRTSALFELVMVVELLCSGRLVPISFMPHWVRNVSEVLPFYYAFGFPIEALIGNMTVLELLRGLGMQALWIGACWLLMQAVWRRAVRRYSAVGG